MAQEQDDTTVSPGSRAATKAWFLQPRGPPKAYSGESTVGETKLVKKLVNKWLSQVK